MNEIVITTEHIRLSQVLKLACVVESGAEAKICIQGGEVQVNGETETRRGRKLRAGDRVDFRGEALVVTNRG